MRTINFGLVFYLGIIYINIILKDKNDCTEMLLALLLMEASPGSSPENRVPGEGGTALGHSHAPQRSI